MLQAFELVFQLYWFTFACTVQFEGICWLHIRKTFMGYIRYWDFPRCVSSNVENVGCSEEKWIPLMQYCGWIYVDTSSLNLRYCVFEYIMWTFLEIQQFQFMNMILKKWDDVDEAWSWWQSMWSFQIQRFNPNLKKAKHVFESLNWEKLHHQKQCIFFFPNFSFLIFEPNKMLTSCENFV